MEKIIKVTRNKKPRSITLPPVLTERAKKKSKRLEMSFSGYIEMLIRQDLEKGE